RPRESARCRDRSRHPCRSESRNPWHAPCRTRLKNQPRAQGGHAIASATGVPKAPAVPLVSGQLPQLASSPNLEAARPCSARLRGELHPPPDQESVPKMSAETPMDFELRFKK